MAIYRVTACWYETVQVEAEDEDAAIDRAYEELRSEIRQKGYVDDYEVIRINLQEILADRDDYLDVFVEEMKYSDTPIRKSIAEDLTDIYQVVKDFVCQFRSGLNETMHDALAQCREYFMEYWGQTLVNTMRALHEVKYSKTDEEEFDED